MTVMTDPTPSWTQQSINLAQPRLGAKVVSSSDEFFASHDRLIDPAPPVFKPNIYDDNGKWMDGWESRRKRGQGHDHCVVVLGRPARLRGIEIDTSHFTGNYVRAASLDACLLGDGQTLTEADWTELFPPQSLVGDKRQFFELEMDGRPWTHLRLNAFPDGGIARMRVHGEFVVDWTGIDSGKLVDLAAIENGGRAIVASDAHFGALANLIAPGRGVDMGDGWETRRRREPGFDWGILRLGHAGVIQKLSVDTAHFKGNFPWKVAIYGAQVGALPDLALPALSIYWPILLPPIELSADRIHEFENELQRIGAVDHLRIDMMPDGGISRLRAWGSIEREGS